MTNGARKFAAAIVGLGNIGFRYDLTAQPGQILSHARAYLEHPGFELLGGVDPDAARRREFEQATGVKACATLADLARIVDRPLEVISVCTPTSVRLAAVEEAAAASPAVILLEKPLAYTLSEARQIVGALAQRGVGLAVNYMRRWDPAVNEIKRCVDASAWGEPLHAHCIYTRGLFNSASHAIDLLHYWFGPESGILNLGAHDVSLPDPTVDFILRFPGFDAVFHSLRDRELVHFEIDLLFAAARVKLLNSGWQVRFARVNKEQCFARKEAFAEEPFPVPPGLDRYQYHVMEGIYQGLTRKTGQLSTGDSALRTLAACVKIKAGITAAGTSD